jgi:hypothetical protein
VRIIAFLCLCPVTLSFQAGSCEKKKEEGKTVNEASPKPTSVAAENSHLPHPDVNKRSMPTGVWGGRHIGMTVTETGAEIEYDCAHGVIEQPIKLDDVGRFDVNGTFVPEGGPISVDTGGVSREKSFAARYYGEVKGEKMNLKVTIVESKLTLDELFLVHGQQPGLEKCY